MDAGVWREMPRQQPALDDPHSAAAPARRLQFAAEDEFSYGNRVQIERVGHSRGEKDERPTPRRPALRGDGSAATTLNPPLQLEADCTHYLLINIFDQEVAWASC